MTLKLNYPIICVYWFEKFIVEIVFNFLLNNWLEKLKCQNNLFISLNRVFPEISKTRKSLHSDMLTSWHPDVEISKTKFNILFSKSISIWNFLFCFSVNLMMNLNHTTNTKNIHLSFDKNLNEDIFEFKWKFFWREFELILNF